MALVELDGSPEITFTTQGITGHREFHCDWSERYAVKPHIGDPFPGFSACRCSSANIKAFGKNLGGGNYLEAKIICEYSSASSTQQQETGHIEENIEFGGEMLTRSNGRWECGDEVVKEDVGGTWYPRVEIPITIIYDDDTFISKVSAIIKATGKINSSGFRAGKFQLDGKERWLLLGAPTRSFMGENSVKRWRVTYKFVGRAIGPTWQEAWHAEHEGGARFEEILFLPRDYPTTKDEAPPDSAYTDKLYEITDFNSLFA